MGHVPKRSLVQEVGGENPREKHQKDIEKWGLDQLKHGIFGRNRTVNLAFEKQMIIL